MEPCASREGTDFVGVKGEAFDAEPVFQVDGFKGRDAGNGRDELEAAGEEELMMGEGVVVPCVSSVLSASKSGKSE